MRQLLLAVILAMVSTISTAEVKGMKLFKVVSTRDEVTVGFAQEMDLDRVATQLTRDGFLRAWQYATARDEKGGLVQKPQREVVLLSGQVIRIEPLDAGQPVIPPQ